MLHPQCTHFSTGNRSTLVYRSALELSTPKLGRLLVGRRAVPQKGGRKHNFPREPLEPANRWRVYIGLLALINGLIPENIFDDFMAEKSRKTENEFGNYGWSIWSFSQHFHNASGNGGKYTNPHQISIR